MQVNEVKGSLRSEIIKKKKKKTAVSHYSQERSRCDTAFFQVFNLPIVRAGKLTQIDIKIL